MGRPHTCLQEPHEAGSFRAVLKAEEHLEYPRSRETRSLRRLQIQWGRKAGELLLVCNPETASYLKVSLTTQELSAVDLRAWGMLTRWHIYRITEETSASANFKTLTLSS